MAGKLGGSGKTREIVLHSEIVVSSTIYRLFKYRYWYRLLCIRIRNDHGIACWLPQAQFMNRGRCFKTAVMVGPWAFGEVILAEEIRAANRVGWRAGRAPNDRTNAYLWVPECDGLEVIIWNYAFDARLLLAVWQKTELTCWEVERNGAITTTSTTCRYHWTSFDLTEQKALSLAGELSVSISNWEAGSSVWYHRLHLHELRTERCQPWLKVCGFVFVT